MRSFLFSVIALWVLAHPASGRETVNINLGWKFSLQDDPAASQSDFDDSRWRTVDLPHDWAYENGFAEDNAQTERGGYASGGIGWYRKTLNMDAKELTGRIITLDFDAAYMNSEVWVNGTFLGKRPYGYVSFGYDITRHLRTGRNVISVRLDNSLEPSARWYHPCGIYGNVSLTLLAPLHFTKWATFVQSKPMTGGGAKVSISTNVTGENTSVNFTILDANGKTVGKAAAKPVSDNGDFSAEITLAQARLWSPDTPVLYTLCAEITDGKTVTDRLDIPFGIREIRWEAETGFWLNGKNTKIRGVCEHLTGGPVGGAWTEELMRWKLQLLKDMGCNTIRTSHNPSLPMFYDLCDRIGIMVVDEFFDGWSKKAEWDYGRQAFEEWWKRDLTTTIHRDRNHPCVILWSVGNETRGEVAKELVAACHREDPTRLVSSGESEPEQMDIIGKNGGSERPSFLNNYQPGDKAFLGRETPHTWQVRGYYRTKTWYRDGFPNVRQDPFELPDLTEKEVFTYDWCPPSARTSDKQIFNSSYDNAMVRISARRNLQYLRDKPWYTGHFRWTGFDYPGEAGYVHGGWPFRAFMGGVIDLAGFEKDHYYLYQSQWSEKPMVHLLPHWTHPYMERGVMIPIWAYTTGDEVELFLNGRSLGRVSRGLEWDRMQCQWMAPWEPGTLEAVAYRKGKEIARTRQSTASCPSKLMVSASVNDMQNGGNLAIVTIDQADSEGLLYPYGENRIHTRLYGSAKMLSLESGNPVDVEGVVGGTSRRAFFGRLRAFVSATSSKGDISILTAAICGDKALKISDRITIEIKELALRGKLPKRDLEIFCTTDGTQPTRRSPRYAGAMRIVQGTTVRAAVYAGEERLFDMTERFGAGEGLYWGEPDEQGVKGNIVPVAQAKLNGATLRTSGIIQRILLFYPTTYQHISQNKLANWLLHRL